MIKVSSVLVIIAFMLLPFYSCVPKIKGAATPADLGQAVLTSLKERNFVRYLQLVPSYDLLLTERLRQLDENIDRTKRLGQAEDVATLTKMKKQLTDHKVQSAQKKSLKETYRKDFDYLYDVFSTYTDWNYFDLDNCSCEDGPFDSVRVMFYVPNKWERTHIIELYAVRLADSKWYFNGKFSAR